MNPRNLVFAAGAIGLLPAFGAQGASAFNLDWVSIDSGAATARGGGFELSATIGQPDAGEMRGGNYVLQTGFWPGPAEAANGARPVLSAGRTANQLILTWPIDAGPLALERSVDIADPSAWKTVPSNPLRVGDEFQVEVPRDTDVAFFRLRAIGNP